MHSLPPCSSVPAASETVWLKDVTATIENDKRTFDNPDLPAQLTFHLRRGLDVMTLQLNRNDEINPNADMYLVENTQEGRPILSKTTMLDKEVHFQNYKNHNLIYFIRMLPTTRIWITAHTMTVRCVKRLSKQCDRVIHGNIRIGDITYELESSKSSDTSVDDSGHHDGIGKRYLLLDQTSLVENKDTPPVHEINVQEELKTLFRRIAGKKDQNHFSLPYAKLPPRPAHDRWSTDKSRQLKKNYYAKVGILIDSSVWDIYYARESHVDPRHKIEEVKKKIREAYLHVMNGVNLRYKSIDDPSISITVIPMNFIFFQHQSQFPHNESTVIMDSGKTYADIASYLRDIHAWDKKYGFVQLSECDAVILFTR
ncbi:hypothetical protein ACJMK2_004334 [Sinanodonta woodiana]|uniref:Uncharacterized protein n=1 Tax=Sinanodonta woodiana TaxID=1069815 RepID=A0ABD3Y0U5_SINWO